MVLSSIPCEFFSYPSAFADPYFWEEEASTVGTSEEDDPIVRLGDERAHCKLCDIVFKNVYIANKHVKQVHNSAAVQCILCARVYKGEKGFSMHLIRVHNLRGVKEPVKNYGKVMQS